MTERSCRSTARSPTFAGADLGESATKADRPGPHRQILASIGLGVSRPRRAGAARRRAAVLGLGGIAVGSSLGQELLPQGRTCRSGILSRGDEQEEGHRGLRRGAESLERRRHSSAADRAFVALGARWCSPSVRWGGPGGSLLGRRGGGARAVDEKTGRPAGDSSGGVSPCSRPGNGSPTPRRC